MAANETLPRVCEACKEQVAADLRLAEQLHKELAELLAEFPEDDSCPE